MMLLEIPSSAEYVSVARQAVEAIARRMPFNQDQIEDLKLAFGEACTNAVKYGTSEGVDLTVEIKCTVQPDGLSIEIRNSTNGAVYPFIPKPHDLTREGGLGLYMIRKLVDEVDMSWEQHTATVRLFKRVGQAA